MEGFQSANQNVLSGVLSIGASAEHPNGDIENPWPMTRTHLVEGIAFAGLRSPYECFI
jgi:hypothetical protein